MPGERKGGKSRKSVDKHRGIQQQDGPAGENERYANDRKHLLSMFPAEVWSLVFKNLDHPSHLENVSNSSLFFREFFLSQRNRIMFQNVWRILESKYREIMEDDETDLLDLRLVCRTWCTAIDTFFESKPYHFEMLRTPKTPGFGDVQELTLKMRESSMEKISRFLPHFEETHGAANRNPFKGRSITIYLLTSDQPEFMQAVQRILEKYGHHVWFCQFHMYRHTDFSPLRIRDAVCLMPNLKALDIHIENGSCVDREIFYARFPTPPLSLPTLEHLQVLRCKEIPTPVFVELLQCNSHISALEVNGQVVAPRNGVSFPLVNLTKLAITLPYHAHFLVHPALKCSKVTELYLRYEINCHFPWENLFKTLVARFKRTLAFLHVDLVNIPNGFFRTFYEKENPKVKLPLLRHLELKLDNLISLDILLPIKATLTTLNLSLDLRAQNRLGLDKRPEIEDCINVFDCARRGRPQDLNIWAVLPQLNTFTFEYCDNFKSFKWSHSRETLSKQM